MGENKDIVSGVSETKEVESGVSETEEVTKNVELTDGDLEQVSGGMVAEPHIGVHKIKGF